MISNVYALSKISNVFFCTIKKERWLWLNMPIDLLFWTGGKQWKEFSYCCFWLNHYPNAACKRMYTHIHIYNHTLIHLLSIFNPQNSPAFSRLLIIGNSNSHPLEKNDKEKNKDLVVFRQLRNLSTLSRKQEE